MKFSYASITTCILKVVAAFSVAALLYSCDSKADPEDATVSITTENQKVSADKGNLYLRVLASGSWKLSMTFSGDETSWASLTTNSGKGPKNDVSLVYSANTSSSIRTVTITLKAGKGSSSVTITQLGKGGREGVPAWLELPAVTENEQLQFLDHDMTLNNVKQRNYSFLWDHSNLVARWVAYPLNASLIGSGSRTDAWGLDPLLPEGKQPVLSTGFKVGSAKACDRGHQIPSADRLTKGINETTFYGTNMTPQYNKFNSGIWENLESRVRTWSRNCDTLYVVTGCSLEGSPGYNYDNKGKQVTVPGGYFKALLRYRKDASDGFSGYMACGFYFDHSETKYGDSVKKSMMMSIDELEKKLGINFFANLPSDIEKEVEAQDPQSVTWWGLSD